MNTMNTENSMSDNIALQDSSIYEPIPWNYATRSGSRMNDEMIEETKALFNISSASQNSNDDQKMSTSSTTSSMPWNQNDTMDVDKTSDGSSTNNIYEFMMNSGTMQPNHIEHGELELQSTINAIRNTQNLSLQQPYRTIPSLETGFNTQTQDSALDPVRFPGYYKSIQIPKETVGPTIRVLPRQIGPVQHPSKNDVLSGRGGRINAHYGNIQFRSIVKLKKEEYFDPTIRKLQKATIAAEIVEYVRYNLGGHFLKLDAKDGMWYDIGDKKAIRKAAQAIRECNANSGSSSSERHDDSDQHVSTSDDAEAQLASISLVNLSQSENVTDLNLFTSSLGSISRQFNMISSLFDLSTSIFVPTQSGANEQYQNTHPMLLATTEANSLYSGDATRMSLHSSTPAIPTNEQLSTRRTLTRSMSGTSMQVILQTGTDNFKSNDKDSNLSESSLGSISGQLSMMNSLVVPSPSIFGPMQSNTTQSSRTERHEHNLPVSLTTATANSLYNRNATRMSLDSSDTVIPTSIAQNSRERRLSILSVSGISVESIESDLYDVFDDD